MGKQKASKFSSERENWGKIFNGMVQILQSQQQQLLSLASDRKFLQDRIKMLHDAWESDLRLYSHQISELKGISIYEEKVRLRDVAKADWLLSLKQREVSILNYKLENQDDELTDFKAWFEFLYQKLSNAEEQGNVCEDTGKRKKGTTDSEGRSIRRRSTRNMPQEENSTREHEVDMGNNSNESALLAEKKFAWNQYKILESKYMNNLKSKESELEKANEKIEKLISTMEQLQSAKHEKDETVTQLESKVGNMEKERNSLNEKLSKLSEELEALRKFRNTQVTPILNHCSSKPKGSSLGRNDRSRSSSRLKKELHVPKAIDPATNSGKDSKGLKRKRAPAVPEPVVPKLFSSDFKVPKLKGFSPNVR